MPSSSFVITGAVRARPLVQRAVVGRMRYFSYQPPNPPSSNSSGGTAAKNLHRAFYSDFGSPILKVFLGALFTYQALYWGWMKLETLDVRDEKNAEIAALEGQLRGLTEGKKEMDKS